jgi:opacity protein-like surface antigen
VGIEGGVLFPKSQNVSGTIDFTTVTGGPTDFATTNIGRVKYKTGYDVDLIGGYDFGMFRLEGELGYKRARAKSFSVNDSFIGALNAGAGTTFTGDENFGINDSTRVWSGMINGLVDFGGQTGIGGYLGAGAGYANVKQFGSSSGKFAWQLLAGVYMPVGSNVDVGLKYRYFNAGRHNGTTDFPFTAVSGADCGAVTCTGGTAIFGSCGRFTSHSLLACLVYNFGAPAPAPLPAAAPPPPPPPAPATQTCPDGSVIQATATCPAPPPPPPPPAPAPERG